MQLHDLQQELHREFEDPANGEGGGCVLDLSAARPVFEYAADTPLVMASTTKIFTAAAALHELGPEKTLRTQFVSESLPDSAGGLDGDLRIIGGGDPTLGDSAHLRKHYQGAGTSGEAIADALHRAGVRRITGSLVVDNPPQ